ncbi:MAG: LLM class flavin-dependent oxidoreductase [Chloroflexota bacterium]|nr:LLM class flavin-dependent oxidoreductase [Chloroflexota bacterium]
MTERAAGSIRFSLFDWLDENRRGQASGYDDRLNMLEYADKAGFYSYHLAEHHGTSLSTVPSPNLFLAAAAQRTSRIRLGALTYVLPLYNPLRLLEELSMLDQLSHGRLDMGIGRGAGPDEGSAFGVTGANSRAIFKEALDVVLGGLSTGELNYAGEYFRYDHVKTRLRPWQRPYPPLWYPTSNIESIPWIAGQGISTVFSVHLSPDFGKIERMLELYSREHEAHRNDPNRLNGHVDRPMHGFLAHVYLAETDELARQQAKPAWAVYYENFTTRYGAKNPWADHRDFEQQVTQQKMLVGSPATVRRQLSEWFDRAPANYFVGCFSFGSLTGDQILSSIDLFAREVMPAFGS